MILSSERIDAYNLDEFLFAVESFFFDGCEFNKSFFEGEESVIFSFLDVLSGYEFRSPLPDDDRSGLGSLSLVELDSQVFGLRIPSQFSCS